MNPFGRKPKKKNTNLNPTQIYKTQKRKSFDQNKKEKQKMGFS